MESRKQVTSNLGSGKHKIYTKFEAEICTENNKRYKVVMGTKLQRHNFLSFPHIVRTRKTSDRSGYSINVILSVRPQLYHINYFSKSRALETAKKIIGTDVVVIERIGCLKNVTRGKIVNVLPKIISTSPGKEGLPVVDEN